MSTRIRVSLADVDPTMFVYYGHYLRYNERAANDCLCEAAGPDCRAKLVRVTLSKYIRGAGWDEDVTIRTQRLAGANSDSQQLLLQPLLHEWCVDGKVIHLAIAEYAVEKLTPGCSASDAFECAELVTGNDWQRCRAMMRIRALQKEAGLRLDYPADNVRVDEYVIYPDMVSEGGTLSTHAVMDLMERQRTTLIGGQETLKALKQRGVAIVCYSLQGLTLSHAHVRVRQSIRATSRFVVLNDRFYCMHQALHHFTGEDLSECTLKLIFVREGEIIKAPDDVRLYFEKGDEGRRYGEHATINGELSPTAVHEQLPPRRTFSVPARLSQHRHCLSSQSEE